MNNNIDFDDVHRRLEIKLAKYKIEDIDDELTAMLYDEAVNEVRCSAKYNGGRKVRM